MSIIAGTAIESALGGYEIDYSVRFNSADSAYLSRTPASAGNRKTWTWSGWVKRSGLSSTGNLFSGGDATSNNDAWMRLNSDNTIQFLNTTGGSYTAQVTTAGVFRDVSAWYHIMLVVDTTQATSTNRIKIYVNGVQQTLTFTTTPSQNSDLSINIAGPHVIGTLSYNTGIQFFSGYLTEVNFIDGQALDPTSFGEYNTDTGVWQPKAYTGSYGTNGFYLNFSDNSGTTSTTLGKDYSGNGNNWTPNNFSVTAGAGNDSLVDSPTSYGTDTGAGGEVRGNYSTLNPLAVSSQGQATVTNGNLDISGTTNSYTGAVSTFGLSAGKWYWEYTFSVVNSTSGAGIINSASLRLANGATYGFATASDCWFRTSGGEVASNSSNPVSGLSTFSANDVMNIAVDFDAGKLWFGKNGTWDSSGNPATGSNATITFTPGGKSFNAFVQGYANSGSWSGINNFGQRPFAYTAPSGFKALCTQNLPDPTIADGSTAMNAVLYTGTGSARSVTVGFPPDFTWIKVRSAAYDHQLYDIIRGAGKYLYSNSTVSEQTDINQLSSFDSNGFSLGSGVGTNESGQTFVSWNWKAGGTGVSNTDGSITSTVSANPTAGFSIVTYTGNGSSGTIGHGLGTAPSMVIVKNRTNGTYNWPVYHVSLTNAANAYIYLSLTNAANQPYAGYWNSTAPTSSVFSVGNDGAVNNNGDSFVAYCFAPVEGYSAFGSYVGNGSADGPFIFTNMRSRYILIKRTDSAGTWWLYDTARSSFNVADDCLQPNASDAELTNNTNLPIDIVSNGFKLRTSYASLNTSSATYIYAAFAENPFKYALAR